MEERNNRTNFPISFLSSKSRIQDFVLAEILGLASFFFLVLPKIGRKKKEVGFGLFVTRPSFSPEPLCLLRLAVALFFLFNGYNIYSGNIFEGNVLCIFKIFMNMILVREFLFPRHTSPPLNLSVLADLQS